MPMAGRPGHDALVDCDCEFEGFLVVDITCVRVFYRIIKALRVRRN